MEIKMSALQIHIVTVSQKRNNQHLITVPWGTVNFVSLVSKCFPRLVVSFAALVLRARAANDTTRAQINNIPSKSHVIPLLTEAVSGGYLPSRFPYSCVCSSAIPSAVLMLMNGKTSTK